MWKIPLISFLWLATLTAVWFAKPPEAVRVVRVVPHEVVKTVTRVVRVPKIIERPVVVVKKVIKRVPKIIYRDDPCCDPCSDSEPETPPPVTFHSDTGREYFNSDNTTKGGGFFNNNAQEDGGNFNN